MLESELTFSVEISPLKEDFSTETKKEQFNPVIIEKNDFGNQHKSLM